MLPLEILEFVFTIGNKTEEPKRVKGVFRTRIVYPGKETSRNEAESIEADGIRWHDYIPEPHGFMTPGSNILSFLPGETRIWIHVLGYEKGGHKLARPGQYRFRGALDNVLSSEVIIVVQEPNGIDKAAYEYLQRYPLHYYFSEWTRPGHDQAAVEEMQRFISRFQGSQYAEMAQLGLALMWMKGVEGKKDLEQARSLLQEVVKSSDKARAARAYYYLGQLAEEQGELMDAHQYYSYALSLKVDPYIEYVAKEAQAKIEPRLSPPKPRRPRR
jgi:hypothetical protein